MSYEIRLATESDVPGILEIYAPIIEETAISFEYEVPRLFEMWKRVNSILEEAPWLVCSYDGKIVGYAYAGPHRNRTAYQWSRELSVYIHADFRGRSIALALYESLITLLKLQGYINAYIGITLPNEPSVKLHEKIGYKLVGIYQDVGYKNGNFHSVGWWQKKISDASPGPIRMLKELRSQEQIDAIEKGLALIKNIEP